MRPPATIYRGERTPSGAATVTVTLPSKYGTPHPFQLTPTASLRRLRFSGGFEWGYRGSGPHQLAAALILDATDDPRAARLYSIGVMEHVVDRWTGDRWEVTAGEIQAVVEWLIDRDAMERDTTAEARPVFAAEGGAA